LFTPEDQRAGLPALEMELAVRSGEYKGGGLRERQDETRFEAVAVLMALRGAAGELLGYLKLTQDVSERKPMEREREAMLAEAQQAREEAEHASRSKDEFLASISHERRTPLSAILGWAYVLERGVLDAQALRHGLQAISRNARMRVQLIEDLLDMSRIENGRVRLELQRIELGAIIAAAIDAVLPAAAARLQQVVANLLNNNIEFTPVAVRSTSRWTSTTARRDDREGWASACRSCVTWWNCTAARCRRAAPALGRGPSSP
jgi:signal transduction histidine kinase